MTGINNQIFTEIPDSPDEPQRHIAFFTYGVGKFYDTYSLACHFKNAGDVLATYGLEYMEAYELLYPLLYNYRHSIELYLKSMLISEKKKYTHNLSQLLKELEELLKKHHNSDIPEWFKNYINEIMKYDPRSTGFRYADVVEVNDERQVDFIELKKIMDVIANSFHNIYLAELNRKKGSNQ